MRYKRIQVISTIMIVLVVSFSLFWTFEYSYRVGKHIFFTDWSTFNFIDDDFVLTAGRSVVACLFYLPVYVVAFTAITAALLLFNQYRKGFIFDQKTSKYLMAVGLSMVAIMAVDTFISSTEAAFMSQWNVGGGLGISYRYDAGDIMIAIAGLGFCLMGWVSREALLIQSENESFI